MSTITREFTKEQLIEHIKGRKEFADECAADSTLHPERREYYELTAEALRIALASLEAEAVGFIVRNKETGQFGSWMHSKADWFKDDGYEVLNAYIAPPAPVSVPEPIKRNDADGWWMYKGRRVGGGCAEWYNRALDDCRAAMLQGADGK